MDPLLLRPSDAARALAMSRTSLYALLATGELESIKVGAARLIPVEALRAFVDRHRGAADNPTISAPPVESAGREEVPA